MSRRKAQLRIVPKETITLHGLRWDDRQELTVTRYEIMRWSVRDDGLIDPWLDDDENYYGDFCDFVIELPSGDGYQASIPLLFAARPVFASFEEAIAALRKRLKSVKEERDGTHQTSAAR